MSIDKLKQRLEQQLSHSLAQEVVHTKFVKPQKLIKTLYVLEQRFDDFENAIPLDQKIFRTISKFQDSGFHSLSKRDWKNLAWALSKILPDTENKLIFSDVGKKIIQHFIHAKLDLIGLVYFPLLYSYFALENEDVQNKPVIWIELRKILDVNQSKIYKDSKRPKKWMNTLIDHSEILSDHPTQSFVHRFLNDSNTRGIQNDLETLKIAPHSWFWDDLIKSSIHSIKKMNEAEFFKFIPRFLGLVEQNALYTTSILIALLERYAKTSHREKVHEVLKNLALNQWGNPQYDSSAGWNNVNAETKRMVIQWFVRADLEAFFKLFSRTADVNRFNYWIKFIDKISFSQIFLGPMAVQSAQSQHKKFRESNRGRLKELIGSTSSNNAFLLKIDNVFVVDFSDTGNACYIVKKLPYKEQDKKVHIDELKPWPNILKLNHIAGWEHRFDEKLAEIGIFSNILKTNSYSSGYKR